MRDELQRDLTRAIAAHDTAAVSALRSALGALQNAEAVDATSVPPVTATRSAVAGSVAGVGAAEVERGVLTQAQVADIVNGERAERLSAALAYERLGQHERAARLREEAEILSRYLPPS